MSLKDELITAIINEQNHFDMSCFVKEGTENEIPSCNTASCIAGWIMALRPDKTTKILERNGVLYEDSEPADIAKEIWSEEEPDCAALDFYGEKCSTYLENISREEAIYHIQNNGEWENSE